MKGVHAGIRSLNTRDTHPLKSISSGGYGAHLGTRLAMIQKMTLKYNSELVPELEILVLK